MSGPGSSVLRGRCWRFGDGVDTDVILPGHALLASRAEQAATAMEAVRAGWSDLVEPGDVLVAGHGFGAGSGRPAARVLLDVGIAAVLAESVNGLFFRGAAAYGLPCLEVAGVHACTSEGDELEVDTDAWTVTHVPTGRTLTARPVPPSLRASMVGGGVVGALRAAGYVAEETIP